MCGICGVISADPRPVEPAVRAMMRAMHHRGPDDEGYELLSLGPGDAPSPVAGFGFRRLAILDLSPAGHQPMFNERTGDCLVFNGEIYNFRQLRAELQLAGVVFRSTSDTEVLLQALSMWGDSAVEKLHGMYSFAFYQASSQRILLARDPLGIKPLYVASLKDRFVFASEIRAVASSGLVPNEFDLAGITGMLAYGAVQSPRTIYQNIRSFPAGSVQWIDRNILTGERPKSPRHFWNFPRHIIPDSESVAVDTVREMLHASVKRHLVADVPVGIFLSAGIDSTIIASCAKQYSPNVKAFTVGFGGSHGEDELALAAETAGELGIEHVAVELDADNMPRKWHEWLAGMDSPSIDGFNTYVVSRRLAAEGVVVGLSGLGADELFGGYSTFNRAAGWSRLLNAVRLIPRSVRKSVVGTIAQAIRSPGSAEKFVDLVCGDASVSGITKSLRRALSDARIHAMGLGATSVGLAADYLEADDERFDPVLDGDSFNDVARTEAVHYMRDTLLRDTDINSMRHSLEVRVPFLDLPLVDYVSAIPGRVKQGSSAKFLLRQAAGQVLTQPISSRRKTGFTLPIGDWMRGVMRDPCEAAILSLASQAFINPDEVMRTWQQFVEDPNSMHWSRPLALVVLGSRLQNHA